MKNLADDNDYRSITATNPVMIEKYLVSGFGKSTTDTAPQ